MKETIRRYWPLWAYATASLIAVVLIAQHINANQRTAAIRAERERQALCVVLANIRSEEPPPIQQLRAAVAPAGHPRQCFPLARATPPHTRTTAAPRPSPPAASPAVVVTVTAQPSSSHPTPRPTATRTPSPRPTPSRSPSPPVCLPPLIPC